MKRGLVIHSPSHQLCLGIQINVRTKVRERRAIHQGHGSQKKIRALL
jgi:hypothetical protein